MSRNIIILNIEESKRRQKRNEDIKTEQEC